MKKTITSFLLVFSTGLLPIIAYAQNWTPTTSLIRSHYAHTATLLSDGRVLVVGNDDRTLSGTEEVYDPVTETWLPTGTMTPRFSHTATLLPNGKVLVVGGQGAGVINSAELYDPVANSWSYAGIIQLPRYAHTATLLPGGKVLVSGGYSLFGESVALTDLYDPATNTWSITGNMVVPRHYHTATLLPDGKVLAVGGYSTQLNQTLSSAEVYDPVTGQWSGATSASRGRYFSTATLLNNGKVLVTGGNSILVPDYLLHDNDNTAEIYDPATNAWDNTGSMTFKRAAHTATLLSSGQVLVTGGSTATSISGYSVGILDSVEIYDPISGTWSTTSSMSDPRSSHAGIKLPNGNVLISGGHNGSVPLSSAEIVSANSPPVADAGPNQTVVVNSFVVLDGSASYDPDFDPITYSWTENPLNPEFSLLSDNAIVNPSFTPAVAGLYLFDLVVNDGFLDSVTSTVTIVVQTPSEAIEDLVEDVVDLNLQNGIGNSLDSKLETAIQALDDLNENNDAAAINSLQAFINAVEAQRGNKISEDDADFLVAAAQEIIDSLNST